MFSRLCLPRSTMCQLAGTLSAESVLYSVPRVTSLATTTSTGRTILTPFSSAAARIARASSTRSGSARLLPMALPWASRKVFAMPPPMTMMSTLASRFLRTLILSLTLAPPMIAANGCSGLSTSMPEVRDLLLHQEAGVGRAELRDPDGRGVRAVRGPEGVVHVDVAVGGERLGELRVVLLLLRVEAEVLEEQHLAVAEAPDGVLRPGAEGVARDRARSCPAAGRGARPPGGAGGCR